MDTVAIQFCWLDPEKFSDLPIPTYHSELASGMDVAAAVDHTVQLDPGQITIIPTGFSVAIPTGYEIQVRPRSGLAIKHGVTVINSPGTIDADYRGEIRIGLVNLSSSAFEICRGDRIAQLVLAPVYQADLQLVSKLSETKRGSGGFGHTGLS